MRRSSVWDAGLAKQLAILAISSSSHVYIKYAAICIIAPESTVLHGTNSIML